MATEIGMKPSGGSPGAVSLPLPFCRSCQEQVRVQEREHLARELHDALGSLLMSAKLDVACIEPELARISPAASGHLHHLMDILNQAMALKRRIIDGLEPPLLLTQGLAKAVARLAQDFSSASGIGVTTSLADVALPASAQLAVYRLAEEALTNIGKYAGASRCSITLLEAGDGVQVDVKDDGVGFNADTDQNFGHGLIGMRHRIEACGGTLIVESGPGSGTHLRAHLPAGSDAAH
ncbi:histidine kinase [Polaromonas sp. CF318]|uniref:sensor histidine kinase n=1 Tax=Polaromonas sp. CF318 TaxID=1144318 RepID=UPI000270F95E|nr:sensor histidine kinase [Polaromonas sp. CF318]EJL86592.1 histidine kinase [Polaromonas sp. CF318]